MAKYDERLTLVQHLSELRSRILRAAIAIAAGMILAAVFNDFVFDLLLRPLQQSRIPESARRITTFSPTEPILISLKVWVYVGLIVAAPVVLYQFWAFVGPAFAPTQRRHMLPIVSVCTFLFFFGVTFGYVVVLPTGLRFLYSVNHTYFQAQNRAADYFSFTAWFLVAFGAVFEMPVVIVLLVLLEVIDSRFLRRNRRYAIVVLAVLAMMATPGGDPFSMLAMFTPLLVLYELSIVAARLIERRRPTAAAAADQT